VSDKPTFRERSQQLANTSPLLTIYAFGHS
jgi:hypothetical protein